MICKIKRTLMFSNFICYLPNVMSRFVTYNIYIYFLLWAKIKLSIYINNNFTYYFEFRNKFKGYILK